MKIYDVTGAERSLDWLRSIYGDVSQLIQSQVRHYRLSEIWAICNPDAGADFAIASATRRAMRFSNSHLAQLQIERLETGTVSVDPGAVIVIRVEDSDGNGLPGIPVARTWPDDSLSALPGDLATWAEKGVFGQTNENGEIGFGMGHGDFYDPQTQQGASSVWPEFGDALKGIGMIAGTSHWTLWPVFTRSEAQPEPEPTPDPTKRIKHLASQIHKLANDIVACTQEIEALLD